MERIEAIGGLDMIGISAPELLGLEIEDGFLRDAKGVAGNSEQALVIVKEPARAPAIGGAGKLADGIEPIGDAMAIGENCIGTVPLQVVGKRDYLLDRRGPGVGDRQQRAARAITVGGDDTVSVGNC